MKTPSAAAFRGPLVAFFLLAASGCGGDPAAPDRDVAGDYEATRLLVSPDRDPIDVLAQGVTVEVTLHEDGTTSGVLRVPAPGVEGGTWAGDLGGRWRLLEDRWVLFNLDADSFLQFRTFRIGEGELASSSDGIEIVLTRR